MFPQGIAIVGANDVEVINVLAVGGDPRRPDIADALQKLVILRSDALPRLRPSREVRQLDIQDCALKSIHPAIDAFHDVIAFPPCRAKVAIQSANASSLVRAQPASP